MGEGVSQNAFSSNLNTVNLIFFPTMVEYSLEDKSVTILWNYGRIYLEVNRYEVSKAVSCYMGYWYIVWKGSTRNRGFNLKNTLCTKYLWGWGSHAKSVFFFNIFTSDLHFDALINPNKAGLFEGSFSWGWEGEGGQFDPPSYFKKNLI